MLGGSFGKHGRQSDNMSKLPANYLTGDVHEN
jgi:hypothetical protein